MHHKLRLLKENKHKYVFITYNVYAIFNDKVDCRNVISLLTNQLAEKMSVISLNFGNKANELDSYDIQMTRKQARKLINTIEELIASNQWHLKLRCEER